MCLIDYRVVLKALTWQRESHGLFDYESSSIRKKDLKIEKPCLIVRQNDTVEILDVDANVNENDEAVKPLFNIITQDFCK